MIADSVPAQIRAIPLMSQPAAPIISGVRGKAPHMSISISNSPLPASAAAVDSYTNPTPAPRTQPANNSDTVTLTQSQQVAQLYQQGQEVPEIATTLSLPIGIVNSYLGISSVQ